MCILPNVFCLFSIYSNHVFGILTCLEQIAVQYNKNGFGVGVFFAKIKITFLTGGKSSTV